MVLANYGGKDLWKTLLNFNSVLFCTAYIIFTFRARVRVRVWVRVRFTFMVTYPLVAI